MEKVTRYITDDGHLFDTEEEALRYEKLLHTIDRYNNYALAVNDVTVPCGDVLAWMQRCPILAKDMLKLSENYSNNVYVKAE